METEKYAKPEIEPVILPDYQFDNNFDEMISGKGFTEVEHTAEKQDIEKIVRKMSRERLEAIASGIATREGLKKVRLINARYHFDTFNKVLTKRIEFSYEGICRK